MKMKGMMTALLWVVAIVASANDGKKTPGTGPCLDNKSAWSSRLGAYFV